jgi:hypothetical protein
MKPSSAKRDMNHALHVAEWSAEMAALREVLAHEQPIVLKLIELFGAVMYRKGVIETLRHAPKDLDANSRRVVQRR